MRIAQHKPIFGAMRFNPAALFGGTELFHGDIAGLQIEGKTGMMFAFPGARDSAVGFGFQLFLGIGGELFAQLFDTLVEQNPLLFIAAVCGDNLNAANSIPYGGPAHPV